MSNNMFPDNKRDIVTRGISISGRELRKLSLHDKIRASSYIWDVGVPRWASCLADGIKEAEEDLIDVVKIEEYKRNGKPNNFLNTATESPEPFEYKPFKEIGINSAKATTTAKNHIVKADMVEPGKIQQLLNLQKKKTKKHNTK